MVLNYNNLTIGDRLVRKKGGIFSKHHALYAGYDFSTNQHLVAENQAGFGVQIITLSQFLNAGKLVRVEYNNLSARDQQIVVSRIESLLGRAYDLVVYNCEHFVNEVLNGKPSSSQIKTGIGVTVGLFLLALAFGSSRQSA